MIQPLISAINWFLGFWGSLPFAIGAFVGLVIVLWLIASVVLIIQHVR